MIRQGGWNDSRTVRWRLEEGPEFSEHRYFFRWAKVLDWASEWCSQVKEPNLWADLEQVRETLIAAQDEDSENTPFTPQEQAEISAQLREIKEYIRVTYSLSSEQLSHVEARFDEAERASRRIGRKDWLLLFSGTILTLIVTDLVTPDAAQHIFVMALHGLGHLFGSGQSPTQALPRR